MAGSVTLIGRALGGGIDAIQHHPLAGHVAGEGLLYDFLQNLLGLPFGELFEDLCDFVLGARGPAGISRLEGAAARLTPPAIISFAPPIGLGGLVDLSEESSLTRVFHFAHLNYS